jgi:hypothetical protein
MHVEIGGERRPRGAQGHLDFVVVSCGGAGSRVVSDLAGIGLDGEENVVRVRGGGGGRHGQRGGGNQGARWRRQGTRQKSGQASYIDREPVIPFGPYRTTHWWIGGCVILSSDGVLRFSSGVLFFLLR